MANAINLSSIFTLPASTFGPYRPALDFTISLPKNFTFQTVTAPSNVLDNVDTHHGLWGRILASFGYALKVEKTDGSTVFADTKSLLAHCLPLGAQNGVSLTQLQNLFLQAINPIDGQTVTAAKVAEFFSQFQSKQVTSVDQAEEALEKLKHRHLEPLKFDRETLLQKLRPGDIFFKGHRMDAGLIVSAQKPLHLITSNPHERQAHLFSHVALYLGDGKIAEASPQSGGFDVRVLSLDDPRFAPDEESYYIVSRSQDPSLAEEAAFVANGVATEAAFDEEITCEACSPHRYAFVEAARSIWHTSWFGPMGRYRYLKQYIDHHRNEVPRDIFKIKSFFYFYFVGYCFQVAESERIMPGILGEEDAPPRAWTWVGEGIFRGIWARIRRIVNWGRMSDSVQLQFDAKRLSPFDFRQFVIRHPTLFQDLYHVAK